VVGVQPEGRKVVSIHGMVLGIYMSQRCRLVVFRQRRNKPPPVVPRVAVRKPATTAAYDRWA